MKKFNVNVAVAAEFVIEVPVVSEYQLLDDQVVAINHNNEEFVLDVNQAELSVVDTEENEEGMYSVVISAKLNVTHSITAHNINKARLQAYTDVNTYNLTLGEVRVKNIENELMDLVAVDYEYNILEISEKY